VPPGQQAYARIDGAKLKESVNEITAVARKSRDDGNQYWGRIAGTKYDDMAETWVENKFKSLGLQNIHRSVNPANGGWLGEGGSLSRAGVPTIAYTPQLNCLLAGPADGCIGKLSPELLHS
jgi:hypothetical protein